MGTLVPVARSPGRPAARRVVLHRSFRSSRQDFSVATACSPSARILAWERLWAPEVRFDALARAGTAVAFITAVTTGQLGPR
jgi:hypothetical protein